MTFSKKATQLAVSIAISGLLLSPLHAADQLDATSLALKGEGAFEQCVSNSGISLKETTLDVSPVLNADQKRRLEGCLLGELKEISPRKKVSFSSENTFGYLKGYESVAQYKDAFLKLYNKR